MNYKNVIHLFNHHRGQFGGWRLGDFCDMETQGPRDALKEMIGVLKLKVTGESGLEQTIRIFESKMSRVEEEYKLSKMTRAERNSYYWSHY